MFKKKFPIIFEINKVKDIAIILLGGRLDSTNIEGVTEKFQNVVEETSNKVIIDLCELHYISSIWLGEFMNFSRYIASKDGKLILVHMDRKIKRVFDVLGFSDNFIILDSIDEAKKQLSE